MKQHILARPREILTPENNLLTHKATLQTPDTRTNIPLLYFSHVERMRVSALQAITKLVIRIFSW